MLDVIPCGMWRQAGAGGAETLRRMPSGFVDEMVVRVRFIEARLVVLP